MRQFLRSTLGLSLLATLLLAMLSAGDPLAHVYWNVVFKNMRRDASPSTILVTVDDRKEWTTADQAELLEKLRRQMPRRVFFDLDIPAGKDRAGDAALRQALQSFGDDLAVVARAGKVDDFDQRSFAMPSPDAIGRTNVVVAAWHSNFVLFCDLSALRSQDKVARLSYA